MTLTAFDFNAQLCYCVINKGLANIMRKRYNSALLIASDAHYGQKRSGSSDPYIVHPIAASGIAEHYNLSIDIVLALLCHDVIEDGGGPEYYRERVRNDLGESVLFIVEGLTDPIFEEGVLRKEKKKVINERLSRSHIDVQMGKICDVKDNTKDVEIKKPESAENYLLEKKEMLLCLAPSVKETVLWKDTFDQIEAKLIKLGHKYQPQNH